MASKYQYYFTDVSKLDIDNTLYYITYELKNKKSALKLYDNLNNRINALCDNPYISKDCSIYGIDDETVRRIKINNYLLFFKIENNTIYITRFLYEKMDITSIINDDKK